MPLTLMLYCSLVALALGAATWVLVSTARPARARSLANLHRGEQSATPEVAATGGRMGSLARRLTLPGSVATLDRMHARAGRPANWSVDRMLTLKTLWVPVSVVLLICILGSGQQPLISLLALLVAFVVYFLPELLLLSRGQERDQQIQLQLADTLDQMVIAVEAGLGFDAAMSRAASNGKGALAEELTRTLQDMRMGRSRRQAFEGLIARSQVEDLRRFVRAILQADAYGISIGDVLRSQAAEMRLKRRQRAEAKAQQVPVKVLMPLMLCILPVLFIVVMAPAAMDMVEAFSNM